MTWTPVNISASCSSDPNACQPAVLAFMTFLVQHFSHSNDRHFSDANSEEDDSLQEFDFIIAGAGSAGCVLANRLSEIEEWKILLVEAGEEEPAVADVPAFNKFLSSSSVDWNYKTQPQANACHSSKGSACAYPSGKVMGGSSTINAMYYSRGNKFDYDNWAGLGNPGWGYEDVLPYFKKSEDNRDHDIASNDTKRHSTGGYLTVQRFPHVDRNLEALIDAWKELGYEQIDYNSERQIGFNRAQFTIINGARQITNGAFLRPIRGRRSNLVVKSNSFVTKVIFDSSNKRAVGVEYTNVESNEIVKKAFARKEVIISAGVLNSPKILMLSGIGDKDELAKVGIKVVKHLPVGNNFQDHVNMIPYTVMFESTSTIVNISDVKNDVAYWMSSHEGPLSTLGSPSDLTGYISTCNEKKPGVPDILVVTQSNIIENAELPKNFSSLPYPRSYYNAMNIQLKLLSIKSKGSVKLNAADPVWGSPLIQPNYFSDPTDLKTITDGAFMVRDFLKTKAFERLNVTHYAKPEAACRDLQFESLQYMECLAKNYTRPGLHGVGTCKMGPRSDREAVVDSRLRVYGIDGLRVIDASVMPVIPRGNTLAPTVMIAEKGSDMIKEDWSSQ